jgi:hypothetical protein
MRHGEFIHLPYNEARSLHASGHVKIVDPDLKLDREIVETDYLYRNSWSKRRLTRIAWCQNYEKNGGAEISSFNVVQVGKRLGFDIVGWKVGGNNAGLDLIRSADLIIANNLHYVDEAKAALLEFIFKTGKPFVKYDHDCYESEREIYRRSLLNVFISPKHAQHYFDFVGDEIKPKSVCIPLAFDVDGWSLGGPHETGTVFVPSYGKCRDNVLDFIAKNPNLRFFIAADTVPPGPNIFKLGKIPYTEMQQYYPKYETVLHCPLDKCAGERILFESIMCGCKVITNENAGHTSWDFDWRNQKVLRPILKKAAYKFWSAIDGVIK